MALDFGGKLNRPGLNGSFGASKKTTGVSSQAAKNLASSSAAHSSSVFSLKGSRKANWVPGQSVRGDTSKYNYQNMRARMNSRSYSPRSVGGDYGHSFGGGTVTVNNGGNGLMKGMMIGQIVLGGLNMLDQMGVFNKVGGNQQVSTTQTTTTNTNQLDSSMNSLSGPGGTGAGANVASTISGMENATDSTTLRAAIGDARGQLTTMNGMTGIYETAATTAQNSMDGFKENVGTTKDSLKTANSNLGTAKNSVNGAKQGRDNMLNAVTKLDAEYGAAVQKYSQAHDTHMTAKANHENAKNTLSRATDALNQAEQTLANTQETITDANGNQVTNPAYTQAKQAVANAEIKKQQAEAAEEKAQAEVDRAAAAEDAAKEAKEQAFEKLGDKKEDVRKAEAQLDKAQKTLDNAVEKQGQAQDQVNIATENYEQAQVILESAKSAVTQLKEHKQDVEKLSGEIDKQQRRLERLENNEIKKYNKFDQRAQDGIDDNTTRQNSIDGEVDSRGERRTVRKMEKTNQRVANDIARRNEYADEVSDTQFIRQQAETGLADFSVSGQKYQKLTTPSGAEVYCRDGQVISEEEYTIAQRQAGYGS